MAFFDFLSDLGYGVPNVARMNLRYKHVIEPHRSDLMSARVLDLGSHDGRWPHALADAEAESVLGIEERPELIAQYAKYPETSFKGRVELICGDFILEMDRLLAEGRQFDVITCLGVYYHTMQHYRMLLQMTAFRPKLIIIDSEFERSNEPIVRVVREDTSKPSNSIAQADAQSFAPIGRVSMPALRTMAKSVGYDVKRRFLGCPTHRAETGRRLLPAAQGRVRKTVTLRPAEAQAGLGKRLIQYAIGE